MTVAEAMDECDTAHQDDDPEVFDVEKAVSAIATYYVREFAAYAERFAAAVQSAAADIEGLSVPAHVDADADPWSAWWSENAKVHPRPSDEDTLVLSLWEDAHDVVDLPNVDKRPLVPPANTADEGSHSGDGVK